MVATTPTKSSKKSRRASKDSNCYVRSPANNIKQVQCAGFLCYRPKLDPMEGGAADKVATDKSKYA